MNPGDLCLYAGEPVAGDIRVRIQPCTAVIVTPPSGAPPLRMLMGMGT